jgi:hypothetical protein
MAGWVERVLLGQNELAGFCNVPQVFLTSMEYANCPGTLHEVSRGGSLSWWTRHWYMRVGQGVCAMLPSLYARLWQHPIVSYG